MKNVFYFILKALLVLKIIWLLLKPGPGPLTWTLKNLDPKNPGSRKTWTLKTWTLENLDSEKPGT